MHVTVITTSVIIDDIETTDETSDWFNLAVSISKIKSKWWAEHGSFCRWLKSNYKKVKRELRIKTPIDDESLSKSRPTSTSQPDALVENFLEREYIKPKLSDFTLNEYSEKVIEFGYIVVQLFVSWIDMKCRETNFIS